MECYPNHTKFYSSKKKKSSKMSTPQIIWGSTPPRADPLWRINCFAPMEYIKIHIKSWCTNHNTKTVLTLNFQSKPDTYILRVINDILKIFCLLVMMVLMMAMTMTMIPIVIVIIKQIIKLHFADCNRTCHLVAITGAIILVPSHHCQVTATHLKIRYP